MATPTEILSYLQHNPKFFEEHAEVLSQIYVPHPHGGRTISLAERQMVTLREKVRVLEKQIAEFIDIGTDNDALSEKMHRLALALMRAPRDLPDASFKAITYHLREDFSVPHVGVRVWGVRHDYAQLTEAQTCTETLRQAVSDPASSLRLPWCGALAESPIGDEVAQWFGASAPHLKSAALMPIESSSQAGGLLVLASEDPHRFYGGMGTLYLERLAQMLSASLAHVFSV
jgi:uncharacterized protein